MRTIKLQVDDDIATWLDETAARERLSIDEVITVLIGLESNLRHKASDGRGYSGRASIYRGYDRLLAPAFDEKS